jgi:anti-anti-sigma regulatory factor
MTDSAFRRVALPPVVDLDALDGVRDRLLEAIETGSVTVAAEKVERLSTNGLLLLLSAAETAKRNKFGFEIAGASASMRMAIDRLGLGPGFAPLLRG